MSAVNKDIPGGAGTPHALVSATLSAGPEGSECTLDQPVTLIGGRRDCQLTIGHPDVSKVHCAILNIGRALILCDLSSRMGTFVNGEAIQSRVLRPGDEIAAGPVPLQLAIEQSDPPSENELNILASVDPPVKLRDGVGEHAIAINGATIGRRQSCAVSIDNTDVSLVHAVVFQAGDAVIVFDLGSRSGTTVNGESVSLAQLKNGDTLGVGGHKLEVALGDASATPRPGQNALEAMLAMSGSAAQAAEGPGASPTDLGSWLTTLQQHVEQAKQELETRQSEIEGQQAALRTQRADLEQREAAILEQEEDFVEREARIANQQAEANRLRLATAAEQRKLEKQRGAIDRDQAALNQAQDDFASQVAAWEQQREADENERRELTLVLEGRERALSRREQEIADQQKDVEQRLRAVTEREQVASEREAATTQQSEDLTRREQALSEHEAHLARDQEEIADRLKKIEKTDTKVAQVREALQKASSVFRNSEFQDADADEMPAPLVDHPIFSAREDDPSQSRRGRLRVPRRDN